MQQRILVVDDDEGMRFFLQKALEKRGYEVLVLSNLSEAREAAAFSAFDLILLDYRFSTGTGIDFMGELPYGINHATPLIMMTAYGSSDIAMEALKKGAYDYFTKPFKLEEIEVVMRRALEKRRLEKEVESLRQRVDEKEGMENIIGESDSLKEVLRLIKKVAPTDVTVLIRGESGSGKELVAQAIHNLSERKNGPFIKLNCVAIPEGLLESELFGHEKGSFTGAIFQKPGKFELAHKGSILLDEIGDMTPSTQAKILRLLQEREFERVGGTKPIKVDVRIIASTNKDLLLAVKEGRFREDLYYRLNVVSFFLPPLRERKEDIPLLSSHFIGLASKRQGKRIRGITKEALELLLSYRWPGNVRELENLLERGVVMAEDDLISPKILPLYLTGIEGETAPSPKTSEPTLSLDVTIKRMEKDLISEALRKTGGVQSKAAKILGISERSLWYKVKKLGISLKGF